MVLGEERLDCVRVSNELIWGLLLYDLKMIPQRGQLDVITIHFTPQEGYNSATTAS